MNETSFADMPAEWVYREEDNLVTNVGFKFELTIQAGRKARYAELVTNHDAVASIEIEIVARQEGLLNDGEAITAVRRLA